MGTVYTVRSTRALFTILGSPYGGLVMHILTDHKHHIRLRYDEKVSALGQTSQDDSPDIYFILFEIRRAATPER